MPLYELGVIIDPEIPPEEETSTLERLEAIITDAGGEVAAKDAWGRRQLAYLFQDGDHIFVLVLDADDVVHVEGSGGFKTITNEQAFRRQ